MGSGVTPLAAKQTSRQWHRVLDKETNKIKQSPTNEILKQINHEVKNTFYNKTKCKEYLIPFLKIEYITYQADKANNSLPLCTQIQTETCCWWWV